MEEVGTTESDTTPRGVPVNLVKGVVFAGREAAAAMTQLETARTTKKCPEVSLEKLEFKNDINIRSQWVFVSLHLSEITIILFNIFRRGRRERPWKIHR